MTTVARTNRPSQRILNQREYADGLLAVGRALAEGPLVLLSNDDGSLAYACAHCRLESVDTWGDDAAARLAFEHWEQCPVIRARALGFDR